MGGKAPWSFLIPGLYRSVWVLGLASLLTLLPTLALWPIKRPKGVFLMRGLRAKGRPTLRPFLDLWGLAFDLNYS